MSLKDDIHDAVQGFKWVINDLNADEKKKQEEQEKAKNTVLLTCPYCGAKARVVWKEGVLPKCPNCGGMFDLDEESWNRMKPKYSEPEKPAAKSSMFSKGSKSIFMIMGVVVVILLAIAAFLMISHKGGNFHMGGDANFEISYSQKNGEQQPAAGSEDNTPDEADDDWADSQP